MYICITIVRAGSIELKNFFKNAHKSKSCPTEIVGDFYFYIMAKNNNKKHRYHVYLRNNFSCVYCGLKFNPPYGWNKKSAIHNGEMFLEIDHIIPLSKGGGDDIDNKQSLCQKCNNKKSNKLESEVNNG